MKRTPTPLLLALLVVAPIGTLHAQPSSAQPTGDAADRNVILVLVDGLRWQEVFHGADADILNVKDGSAAELGKSRARFWRDTPEARRDVLMPFFWKTIAKEGQLLGNRDKGCGARVTNGHNFSYPGYSEMLVGFPDPRIDSNDKKLNPNTTVFEWLNGRPGFSGRVAAIGAWDVVPWIFNRERCGFFVNGGIEPITQGTISPEQALLNKLKHDIPSPWDEEPYDGITFRAAIEYLKANKPRVFYLSFGETDEFGHAGKYLPYLDAVQRTDGFIGELWTTVQAMPEYKGTTTLIVSTDHGRGDAPNGWRNHNKDTPGSENIWIAVLGPDTPALGERASLPMTKQGQIAATIAAAVGEDYCAAVPKAAKPIAEAVKPAKH